MSDPHGHSFTTSTTTGVGMTLKDVLEYPGMAQLSHSYKGSNYAKQTLQWFDNQGIGHDVKSAADLEKAVSQLQKTYPALGNRLAELFGAAKWQYKQYPQSSQLAQKSAAFRAAWDTFSANKYTVIGMDNPMVAAGIQSAQNWRRVAQDQTAAGIRSATEGQQANAIDNAQSTIQSWAGLNATQKKFLTDVVGQLVSIDGNHIVNQNALMDILRGNIKSGLGDNVDKKIKADYDQAFPGLRQYNSSGDAVKYTESQYMQYTQQILNASGQWGAPIPTQAQIGELLNHHVSAPEYQQRVVDVYAAVQNSDPGTRQILHDQYGVNTSDLMHYMINGSLPTLQRQVASAEIQDYSKLIGLNGLTQSQAEELASKARLSSTAGNQVLGSGVGQIKGDLAMAAKDQGLLSVTPGGGGEPVDLKTLIGSQVAGFDGTVQQQAATNVQRAEQARVAPFEKGGGYAEGPKGVTGLGSAKQ